MGWPAHARAANDREVLDSAGEVESFVPTLQVGDVMPALPLVDQHGRSLSLRSGAAPTVVSFIESRCPDARTCPLVTAKFGSIRHLVRGTGIRLVEISLDPGYDRPAVLVRYAAATGVSGADWLLATGRPSDVAIVAQRLGIFGNRTAGGDREHTEAVAILSGAGRLISRIDGSDWSAEGIAAQARDDAGLSSDPLRRIALPLFARVSAACGSDGSAGLPIVAALAIFAFLAGSFGYAAFRTFAPAFSERP